MTEPALQPGEKRIRAYLGTVDAPEGSATGLYLIAKQYRQAVLDLVSIENGARLDEHMFRPLFHVAEQCIELLLKALILNTSADPDVLKDVNVRHNLEALLVLATSCGLNLNAHLQEEINESALTTKSHFFRYGVSPKSSAPEVAPVFLPNPVVMISAIETLGPEVARALGQSWP
jgi:hypothetical protein